MKTRVAETVPYHATTNVILAIIAIGVGATAYFVYEILVALKVIVSIT